jgi:hypothetical protein
VNLAWDDALWAAAALSVDPSGLRGVWLRAPHGPVRDNWLTELTRLHPSLRRLPGHADSERLLGGLGNDPVARLWAQAERVRAYLDQRGVPYVDNQAALALVVPVAAANVNPNDWAAQWVSGSSGKADETSLAPYIASTRAWSQRPTTADVQSELTAAGAARGVIAEAYMQGPQYYVRLTDMRATLPNPTIGVVGPFVSLSSAQSAAVGEMERAWKASSVIRSTGSTGVSLVANFADLQQWTRIRKGLEASRLVRDLNVESISVAGADITFNYAGSPEQLQSDLRSRGVELTSANGGWVLQATGAP